MGLNPVKYYQSLKDPKGRKTHQRFLLEGPKFISDAVFFSAPDELLFDESKKELLQFQYPHLFQQNGVRILDHRTFVKIADTQTAQGALAVYSIPEQCNFTGGHVLVFNGLQDPGNLGTMIRTALAFGIDQFLLDDMTADPYSPKVVRASSGMVVKGKFLRVARLTDFLLGLKGRKYIIVALEADGPVPVEDLPSFDRLALVLGSEGAGIEKEILALADMCCSIRINGAESLNAAAAGTIALYLLSQRGQSKVRA
jgi:TrmH family RNA methyltransferase